MRVMEPIPKRKMQKANKKPTIGLILSILILIIMSGYAFSFHTKQGKRILGIDTSSNTSTSSASTEFRFMNGYDFQALYEHTAYPNTKMPLESGSITGNNVLDARIRQIAESRGYKKQAVPVQPLTDFQETKNTLLLQPLALEGVNTLLTRAKTEGVPLQVRAAYRSDVEQRELFIRQLGPINITPEQVQSGQLDGRIAQVLETMSPPGYSRLQTGFGVVFMCGNTSGLFKSSICHTWLRTNNYAKAKQAGLIPSYAETVGAPDARHESEYVWVGTAKLYQ